MLSLKKIVESKKINLQELREAFKEIEENAKLAIDFGNDEAKEKCASGMIYFYNKIEEKINNEYTEKEQVFIYTITVLIKQRANEVILSIPNWMEK